MKRSISALLALVLLVVFGCDRSPSRKPEQRVEGALKSPAISAVEENLALIPEGTPGREKVVAHLAELKATSDANAKAREAGRRAQAKAKDEENKRAKAAGKAALARLRTKRDEIEKTTYYLAKESPANRNSRSELFAYIAKEDGGAPALRLMIQYVADEWLFVQRFVVVAGDTKTEIEPAGSFAVERDNGNGKIWEWYDAPVEAEELAMLRAIAKADSTTLRYEGRQYRKDRKLSPGERQRVAAVLDAFAGF